jgi:putative flippase GtrA
MTPMRFLDGVILRMLSLVFKKEASLKAVHQFVKFALIGVVNTLIDFAIYFTLTRYTEFFSQNIYVANTIAFVSAATFSYLANRSWAFTVEGKANVTEAVKFYGTAASGFLINMAIFIIGISVFGMFDLLAKVIATLVAILWNFFITKFWVFKVRKKKAKII